MNRAWAILLLALLALWPGAAQATSGGKPLRYGGGGQGTVLFDGRLHAFKGFRCQDCHTKLFDTKKSARITMADHFSEKACFKCHNNNQASDPLTASRDCATCHRKVASSQSSSTGAMGGVIATAFAGDNATKAVFLSGKQGATIQSQACLSCHGAPTPPKAVTERGKTLNLHIETTDYRAGTHANLSCATCHIGTAGAESFTRVPHAQSKPDNATCLSCHGVRLSREIKAFNQSAHKERLKDKMTCGACHNPHSQPSKPAEMTYLALASTYNARCLSCHANAGRLRDLSGRSVPDASSGHSFMTQWTTHNRKVLCVECHTPLTGHDPHLIGEKKTSVRGCVACHSTDKSLIVERAGRYAGGAGPVTAGYFPPKRVAPALDCIGGLALAGVLGLVVLHGLGRMFTRRASHGALAVTLGVYPLYVRRTHWLNALLFVVLGFTGLSVRFQGAGWTLGLEAATRLHQACAALLAVNFLAYVVLAVRSGDIRQYFPAGQGWLGRMALQAGYYLAGIFRGAPHPFPVTPENRFNPLQQAAYLVVFLLGLPLLMLSGLLLVLPESATAGIAPRQFLVAAHYAFVLGFALFAVGHVYLATTGARVSSLVRGMFTGSHEHQKEGGPDQPPA